MLSAVTPYCQPSPPHFVEWSLWTRGNWNPSVASDSACAQASYGISVRLQIREVIPRPPDATVAFDKAAPHRRTKTASSV